MNRYVRIGVSVLVAFSLALMAVNVSAANHLGASTKPPKLQKGVTLTIWDFFGNGSSERATEESVIKQWEKISGDHVNTPQNPSNTNTKMCVSAPTGNGPDIIGVPHDQVSVMVKCDVLSAVPAWAWPPTEQNKFIKAARQAVTLYGKVYAMPWAIETTGLFYNKALISSSAFKPAAGQKYLTWQKLISTVRPKTDLSANKLGIAWDPSALYFDYAVISGDGGYVFKYVKGKGFQWQNIGLDNAGAIKAITFLKDLTTTGKYKLIPSTMTSSIALGLFTTGKLAVYLTGPWDEQNFQKANISFGFAPDPSLDGKHPAHPFSGVQVYSLNKYSKHPNEAASLLSYLTTHMQLPEFKSSGRIPVINSLLKSKTVAADAVAAGLGRAALAASPMPNIPEMNQVWTPYGNALAQVMQGKATPAAAAHAAVKQIKADIVKAHGG